MEGAIATPMADQFSLAAIAFEWMFGHAISGPADRDVDVRAIPNVDRSALSKAFTRALAPGPFRRFATCTDFCDAIAASAVPSMPLTPSHHAEKRVTGAMAAGEEDEDPVEPFVPEEKVPVFAPVAPVADLSLAPEESDTQDDEPTIVGPPPVPSRHDSPRFGGLALIVATLIGAIFGFAAGYMARPRALQSARQEITAGTDAPVNGTQSAKGAQGVQGAQGAQTPAPRAPSAPSAAGAPAKIGRLLVRSTPSGARVEVDDVARGVTPLALRDLDLGAREILVSRRGYESEARRIVLTKARPSRSVEVRLSQQSAAAPRPSTPASLGQPSASPAASGRSATGALAVDSRPAGASVLVNGKPSGTTPVTLNDLPPGDYRVTMTLEGHRPFATTVRVVAGERARAAARLTEQEQE